MQDLTIQNALKALAEKYTVVEEFIKAALDEDFEHEDVHNYISNSW